MKGASRYGKKSSLLNMESKGKTSSRSPLKDLNSCSSSNSSSLSVEAPKGCLRFFLSNYSSSRTPVQRPNNVPRTPKSAPNPRLSNPMSKPPSKNLGKSILENPEKPISKHKPKVKKCATPCIYQWQTSRKPSSRQPQELKPSLDQLESGSEQHIQKQKHLNQQQLHTSVMGSGKSYELRFSCFNENGTPNSKLANASGLDSTPGKVMEDILVTTTTTNNTPPIQASVSPEIQGGSSLASTSACFAAGHVVSGVTDKRKCRPKGILTVGENDLGFCKASVFDGPDDAVNNSRASLVPPPVEASMCWLLPACVEVEDQNNNSANDPPEFRRFMALTPLQSTSPPSSGHGFSSDVCNSSNSTSTSTYKTVRASSVSPIGPPEFQEITGPTSKLLQAEPAHNHLNYLRASSSPSATSNCKNISSQLGQRYRYDISGENSPLSWDSLGSGNAICTPQSDSSSDRWVSTSSLNVLDHQKHNPEYDLMAEVLQNTSLSPHNLISLWDPADVLPLPGFSFQFPHLTTPSNSVDSIQPQKTWDDKNSQIPGFAFENGSKSHLRISWREGLVSRIFEMDELDCCRWLSDEGEDSIGCGNDQFISDDCAVNDPTLTEGFGSPEISCRELCIDEKNEGKVPSQIPSSCAESISTVGGGLGASDDSDWTLCYKNQLFEM